MKNKYSTEELVVYILVLLQVFFVFVASTIYFVSRQTSTQFLFYVLLIMQTTVQPILVCINLVLKSKKILFYTRTAFPLTWLMFFISICF